MNSQMKKVILLDKSVLHGTSTHKLKQFVNNHFLILPRVLYDECVMDEKDPKEILLKRFGDVVAAGGYTCKDGMYIVQREGQMLQPFPYLADHVETDSFRETVKRLGKLPKPDSVEHIYKIHMDAAQFLLDSYDEVAKTIDPEKLEDAEAKRGTLEANKLECFRFWIETIEHIDIHTLAVNAFRQFTNTPDRYCLSNDWVTWHYLKIATALAFEYTFRKGKPGKNQLTNAEHDIQDLEYVFLLSKAGALLTGDHVCSCLAKAAFPDKDVFSSLDEVPEEYVCNLT